MTTKRSGAQREPRAADDAATPLAAVVAALQRAEECGELSANEVAWSIARLSGKVKRGNPYVEGVDRRDSVMRAAVEVFGRRGYNHATIEEIANELFLTKAGVYHYFASKQEILDAICERASEAMEAAVIGAAGDDGDPPAKLRGMLEAYTAACMSEPGFTVVMRHLDDVSAPVLAAVQRRRKSIESEFRRTLEDGIRASVFETQDTRVAVFGMLGTINWIYAWFRPGGRLSADEVRDILVTLVLNSVIARPARAAGRKRPARRSEARA